MVKYIIFEDENGLKYPIAFPNVLVHKQIAAMTQYVIRHSIGVEAKPIAAGEIKFGDDLSCSGESETLKLKSRHLKDRMIFLYGEQMGAILE